MTITNLNDLRSFLASVPEGTTSTALASDMEAGNIDQFRLEYPDGKVVDVSYSGPVEEGYVSPFETGQEDL